MVGFWNRWGLGQRSGVIETGEKGMRTSRTEDEIIERKESRMVNKKNGRLNEWKESSKED
jgi:hypothetical protein